MGLVLYMGKMDGVIARRPFPLDKIEEIWLILVSSRSRTEEFLAPIETKQ